MAEAERTSPFAPTAVPPEKAATTYEAKVAPDAPGGRGPLRFEEGVATDTAVPADFVTGMSDGYQVGPRPNQNATVWYKPADEVLRERAHLGSAAWTESPTYTQSFAEGAGPEAERRFVAVDRDGGRQQRVSPAVVND